MSAPDKLYQISLKSSGSYVLSDIEQAEFEGVPCFRGIARSKWHDWLEGKVVFIPTSDVAVITEYDSRDEYMSAVKLSTSANRRASIRNGAFWITIAIGYMGIITLFSRFMK